MKRDLVSLHDFTAEECDALFRRTQTLKEARKHHLSVNTLQGRTLVGIFEKASTRTRVSFEAAMQQLGGSAITLPVADSQLARGEPLSDTAKVISRYADAIVLRTFSEARFLEFARHATVPVINGLTDEGHPVQVLADLFTVTERFNRLSGLTFAFVGDCASNMGRSYAEAAQIFEFQLNMAAPQGYTLPRTHQSPWVKTFNTLAEAVKGADVVITDVWASMGQEKEAAARKAAFVGFCVDEAAMKLAKPTAIFMHCLPAHRGEEVSSEVLDGPQSVVWDEAENRMHVQKALLEKLVLENERETVEIPSGRERRVAGLAHTA